MSATRLRTNNPNSTTATPTYDLLSRPSNITRPRAVDEVRGQKECVDPTTRLRQPITRLALATVACLGGVPSAVRLPSTLSLGSRKPVALLVVINTA
ncbi:hypothetical protein LSAT2_021107 [Lamellibrachia satsuma]|nr:hypothetical protein LSAT2_021107 [Lamellibrachia satsuma]